MKASSRLLFLFSLLLLSRGLYCQAFNFSIQPSNTVCYSTNPVTVTVNVFTVSYANTYSWSVNSPSMGCQPNILTSPPNSANALLTFSCCGIYTITCYGLQNNTIVVSVTQTLSVVCSSQPSLTITNSSANSTVCPGSPVNLSASGANSYFWNNVASGPSVTVTPSVTTTYSVTGFSSVCAGSTYTTTVFVLNHPPLTVNYPAVVCNNAPCTTLIASIPGGTWNGGPGISSVGILCPMLATMGANNFSYTVNYSGCQLQASNLSYTVYPFASAALTSTVLHLCFNSAPYNLMQLAQYTLGGAWSGPGVVGNNMFVPSGALGNTTAVSYYRNINANQLCSDWQPLIIHIGNPPQPTIAAISSSFCSTDPGVQLTVSPVNSGSWTAQPYLSATGVFIPSLAAIGTNTVQYVTGSPTCSLSDSKTLTVIRGPALSVNGNSSICVGETTTLTVTGAPSFTWSNASTASFVTVSPQTSTVISVTGQMTNTCKSTIGFSVNVLTCVGLGGEFSGTDGIVLFPNPAQNEVKLSSPDIQFVMYRIYDVYGRLADKGLLNEEAQINTSALADGLYVVLAENEALSVRKRITIRR